MPRACLGQARKTKLTGEVLVFGLLETIASHLNLDANVRADADARAAEFSPRGTAEAATTSASGKARVSFVPSAAQAVAAWRVQLERARRPAPHVLQHAWSRRSMTTPRGGPRSTCARGSRAGARGRRARPRARRAAALPFAARRRHDAHRARLADVRKSRNRRPARAAVLLARVGRLRRESGVDRHESARPRGPPPAAAAAAAPPPSPRAPGAAATPARRRGGRARCRRGRWRGRRGQGRRTGSAAADAARASGARPSFNGALARELRSRADRAHARRTR